MLAGTTVVVEVECSEPGRAAPLVEGTAVSARVQAGTDGLEITLPAGAGRPEIAEISRVLVEGGIALYRIQPVQATLESWFLAVTSRLGEPE